MKKKRRLKKWVKDLLLSILGLAAAYAILALDYPAAKKAYDTCISRGYSEWECSEVWR